MAKSYSVPKISSKSPRAPKMPKMVSRSPHPMMPEQAKPNMSPRSIGDRIPTEAVEHMNIMAKSRVFGR